jgi:hypothetical protein
MLVQEERPLWQSNYKSMSPLQLLAELQRIARFPNHYENLVERKACIATELALRGGAPEVPKSIIVLEAD